MLMTTSKMFRSVCSLVLCVAYIEAYKHYQERFPNGESVPHPCKPNYLWKGVGHKNVDGGGDRNPFGRDFAANGHKWNRCICKQDSDGDGRTNGEELGDPDCVWTEGALPARTVNITHPGVCTPLDSRECIGRNDWSFCDYKQFDCPAAKEPDVTNIEIRFPNTSVPAQETTYWCMTFSLPNDTDYHLIASEPLIDNENVMHHIIVSGCDDEPADDTSWWTPQPTECGMSQTRCRHTIALWAVGGPGTCEPKEFGYRIGTTGFKAVSMQFHWNNPERRADYRDMSGMRLYLTKTLRPNDAAILTTGPVYMNIPPGMSDSTHVGRCTSGCTSWLPHSIKIADLAFHMHYLGKSAALEHIRGNDVVKVISEPNYSYDSPVSHRFDPPIEFLPGDELKLTCNFQSKTRSRVTYFGDGTADEMCFVFLTYYPARSDFLTCTPFKSLDVCQRQLGGQPFSIHPTGGCNYELFFWKTYSEFSQNVTNACTNTTEKCSDACNRTLTYYRETQPCLQGDVGLFTELQIITPYFKAPELVALLHVCDAEWDRTIIFRDEKPNWTIDKKNTTTKKPPTDSESCIFDNDFNPSGAVTMTANVLLTVTTTYVVFWNL